MFCSLLKQSQSLTPTDLIVLARLEGHIYTVRKRMRKRTFSLNFFVTQYEQVAKCPKKIEK